MIVRDHGLFGDAPGLGKSGECLLLDNAIEAKKTLVICPASLRLNWEREIRMWSTRPKVTTYPVTKARDGVNLNSDFVITSYDMLRNEGIFRALMCQMWDHLVLDEAHYLKDPRGNKRTNAITASNGLNTRVGRISMASGTILPNQPIECYNAVRLLNWDAIDQMSLEAFRNNYYAEGGGFVTGWYETVDSKGNPVRKRGPHWSDKVRNRPVNLDDLRYRLRKHLMVRRLKEDVLDELPEKQWHIVPLQQTSQTKKALAHEGFKPVSKLMDLGQDFDDSVPIDGSISTAMRELGEAKAPDVIAYIEQLMTEGVEKLVVGAWHRSVLKMMREKLDKYGLVYMDGNTSQQGKQNAVDDFQNKQEIKIILGQVIPLGEGWTLTEAQDVVLAEPYWVPGKNDQLVDRIHRIGQRGNKVLAHVPVVADSLDEKVLSRVVEKEKHIYRSLDHR